MAFCDLYRKTYELRQQLPRDHFADFVLVYGWY